ADGPDERRRRARAAERARRDRSRDREREAENQGSFQQVSTSLVRWRQVRRSAKTGFQGVKTVRITSPARIAAKPDSQSARGATRETRPARSSFPSSAHRASRGKSSDGRWSPPCETTMRARLAKRRGNSTRAVSPAG